MTALTVSGQPVWPVSPMPESSPFLDGETHPKGA